MDKLHEECAVIGVSTRCATAAETVYTGLVALQHRGQEGTGIAIAADNRIRCRKSVGLVSEFFDSATLDEISGSRVAIGHNRYSTTGCNTADNVQPFVTEFLTGRVATAHNGNITNSEDIRALLRHRGVNFKATSDSEVVSALIAYRTMQTGDIISGLCEAATTLVGAFSLLVLGGSGRIAAIRDAHGFRPLCIGENENGICIASESCALDSCGFRFVRDVEPGELVVIEDGRIISSEIVLERAKQGLCIFELVYFARADSVIDGQSVYKARYGMGMALAREHRVEADMVCGVPDSGIEAAMGYAAQSGIPYGTALVKNRYIGRSFIYPAQAQRELAVRLKLNPLSANVAGKRIVLVDDSIVRGTTSARIIAGLRAAGAKEVHMRISSPPFLHACYFGTDIDNEDDLMANNYSIDEICSIIGADSLGFISIDGLRAACTDCSTDFCTGCFSGHYPVDIAPTRKNRMEHGC